MHVIDVPTSKKLHYMQRNGVASIEWSPLENYLITCEKDPNKPVQSKNLLVWDVQTGQAKCTFDWPNLAKDGANSIKFDEEEKFMARQVAPNAIDVYDASNLETTKM